jgi:hypothetical protein
MGVHWMSCKWVGWYYSWGFVGRTMVVVAGNYSYKPLGMGCSLGFILQNSIWSSECPK